MNTHPLLDTYRRIQILNDLLLKYLDELIDAQDREGFKDALPDGVVHAAAERRIETKDARKAKYFEELKAALEEEHPAHMCRNNTCDIDAARVAGLYHYAASVLINATECPATEKVFATLERAFNQTVNMVEVDRKLLLRDTKRTKCPACNSIIWGAGAEDFVVCGNCMEDVLVPAAIRHAEALKEVREKLDAAPEYQHTCRWCGKADTEHPSQHYMQQLLGAPTHVRMLRYSSGPGCAVSYKAGFPGAELPDLNAFDWSRNEFFYVNDRPLRFDWDEAGILEVSIGSPGTWRLEATLDVSRAQVIDVIKLICKAPEGPRDVNE